MSNILIENTNANMKSNLVVDLNARFITPDGGHLLMGNLNTMLMKPDGGSTVVDWTCTYGPYTYDTLSLDSWGFSLERVWLDKHVYCLLVSRYTYSSKGSQSTLYLSYFTSDRRNYHQVKVHVCKSGVCYRNINLVHVGDSWKMWV